MALEVYWTRRASNNIDKIAEYILEEWGINAAKNFVAKAYYVIDLLIIQPEIGALQNPERNIRGIVVVEQVTLFYRIQEDKIILLNFFDNRKHPKKRY